MYILYVYLLVPFKTLFNNRNKTFNSEHDYDIKTQNK